MRGGWWWWWGRPRVVGERWRRLCGMESVGKVKPRQARRLARKKKGVERMLKDEERGGKMGKENKKEGR